MKNIKPILFAALSVIAVSCLMTGCNESGEKAADSGNEDAASNIFILDINDYDPSAVLEWDRRCDEQKTKYGKILPTDYTDIPRGMIYGIMTDIDNLMASNMEGVSKNGKTMFHTDREGRITTMLDRLITQNAEIVFEDGSAASEENLTPGTAVLVEYDMIEESYPANICCTKIVILK